MALNEATRDGFLRLEVQCKELAAQIIFASVELPAVQATEHRVL
jgi:hypothetical protein